MVPEFESAVRVLQPGEVSPVVETRFGLHVVKLLERQQPPLEEVEQSFRDELTDQRIMATEDAYIDSLVAGANVRLASDAPNKTRQLAQSGALALRGSRRQAALATYRGGALTADEFVRFLSVVPMATRDVFARGTDEQIVSGLRRLVRDELLVRAARDRGIVLDSAVTDSLRAAGRQHLMLAVRAAGFRHADFAASDTMLDRQVESLFAAFFQGRRPLGPLGAVGLALQEKHTSRIYEDRLGDVAARVQEIRAQRGGGTPARGSGEPTPGPAPPRSEGR